MQEGRKSEENGESKGEGIILTLPAGPINRRQQFPDFERFRQWCAEQQEFIRGLDIPETAGLKDLLRAPYDRFLELVGSNDSEAARNSEEIRDEFEQAIRVGLLVKGSPIASYLPFFGKAWTRAGFLARIAGTSLEQLDELARSDKKGEGSPLDSAIKGYTLAGAFPGVAGLSSASNDPDGPVIDMATLNSEIASAKYRIDDAVKKLNYLEGERERILSALTEATTFSVAKEYWEKKYRRHDIKSRAVLRQFQERSVCGAISIFIIVVLLGLLHACFPAYFSNLSSDVSLLPFGWSLVTAFLTFTPLFLFIWHLRTLHASAKMHRLYAEDAQMRSTMIAVYLALMKQESNAVKKEDRALLLNAILRPLEGGQKDDGPPPGLLELLTRER
ncbi:hypothetical protein [Kordiimonas sp.]|uniref:hypothetical protein n=1 Tax=Kordiimonas sp. TaxID=1970157 RepID=UPI003A921F0E